jgi:hypothetical protein
VESDRRRELGSVAEQSQAALRGRITDVALGMSEKQRNALGARFPRENDALSGERKHGAVIVGVGGARRVRDGRSGRPVWRRRGRANPLVHVMQLTVLFTHRVCDGGKMQPREHVSQGERAEERK